MRKKGIKDILREGAAELGAKLSDEQTALFLTYLGELRKWNRTMNLTSLRKEEEITTRHFLDSLTPLRFLKGCRNLLDIGTGAGFPGIPLKIALPALKVTLMEPITKKVHFLKHVIRTLGLEGIEVVRARAEDEATVRRLGRSFDCAVSRALASIDDYLELVRPYVGEGGVIIAIKGPAEERLMGELGGHIYALHEIEVPFSKRKTSIVVFQR